MPASNKFHLLRSTALGLAAAWTLGGASALAQDASKPNILVIWGDDIGQFNTSAYNLGMMGYRTPNIDQIAKDGVASCECFDPFGLD